MLQQVLFALPKIKKFLEGGYLLASLCSDS